MQGKKNVKLAKEINKINNVKCWKGKISKRREKKIWQSFDNVSVEKKPFFETSQLVPIYTAAGVTAFQGFPCAWSRSEG